MPDTVIKSAGRTSANNYTVFVIFGVILGMLSIVIIALVVHIQKKYDSLVSNRHRNEEYACPYTVFGLFCFVFVRSKRPKTGTVANFDVRTKFEGFKRTNPVYDEKRLVGVGTKMQNPLFNPKEDSANPLYTATVKS